MTSSSCSLAFAGRQVDERPVVGEPHLGRDVLFQRRLATDLQGLQTPLVADLEIIQLLWSQKNTYSCKAERIAPINPLVELAYLRPHHLALAGVQICSLSSMRNNLTEGKWTKALLPRANTGI